MTDPTALPDFGESADEPQSLRDAVLAVFRADGIPAEIDDDGDVSYQITDDPENPAATQTLFVRCNEGDLPILRVLGQWQIAPEIPGEEVARLQAATEVTLRLNMAKVGVENGLVIALCDQLVIPGADVRGLLQLSTQLVLTGVQLWHQVMLGENPFDEGAEPAQ